MVKSSEASKALSTEKPGLSNYSGESQSEENSHTNRRRNKRRLAATRGFDNSGLSLLTKSPSYINPATINSFTPIAGSTPNISPRKTVTKNVLQQTLSGINSLVQSVRPKNKHSSGPLLPPRKPSVALPTPSTSRESGLIRQSVITPLNTPESSLDWDNYIDPSIIQGVGEQQPHEAAFSEEIEFLSDLRISLVPVSETSNSPNSIEGMSRFQHQEPFDMDPNLRNELQNEMNVECKKLMDMHQDVIDLMDDYTIDDVNIGNTDRVDARLKEISDSRSVFRKAVRRYKDLYGSYGDREGHLDSYLTSLNNAIRTHSNGIWDKVVQICPPMTQYERESLAIQREQIQYQQHLQQEQTTHQSRRHSVPRDSSDHGIKSCEAKRLLFRDELRHLTDSLMIPDYGSVEEFWREQSETEVRKAMRKLADWDRSVIRISRTFREYEMLSKQYRDNSEELEADTEEYLEIRNTVKEVTIAVQSEDEKRNLQTLETAKTDKVGYPTFSGEPGEDLVRFREKINDCFRKNRVPESDQLDKLRENLKGTALKRVPVTVKTLSTAWKNLEEAFGSPLLVLRERLKSLNKIGSIPSDSLPAKQITWFHEFESVLQDVLDLGNSTDMNMQMGAFGPPVQEQILKAFSDHPLKKQELAMAGNIKQPKDKILAYQEKVIEYRRRIQLAEVEYG